MRSLVFMVCVAMTAAMLAQAILVPTQPVSPYADTEVFTNVMIQTERRDVTDVKCDFLHFHVRRLLTPWDVKC